MGNSTDIISLFARQEYLYAEDGQKLLVVMQRLLTVRCTKCDLKFKID
ncbi:hypothetical protein [Microseira sp. BLCC-F43]